MLLAHKSTGEFYTHTTLNVLDVSANHLSRPLMGDEDQDLEGFINQNFQKCRGDHFQLVRVIEEREKTLRSVCGSDNQVWTEAYRICGQQEIEVVKILKWTGKKFVEVV